MSVDKLVDSTQLDADLTSVANAIRTKGGTSASLAFPAEFVSAIEAISGGGGLPSHILNHETIVPATDITKSNPIQLQLSPVTNYLILIFATGVLTRPASSGSRAYELWTAFKTGNTDGSRAHAFLLTSDGNDTSDSSGGFNNWTPSTGALKYPSSNYANLRAGATYELYLFEIGGLSNA
jgi:hypothetical protein